MSCKICNTYKVKSQYRNLSLAIVKNTPNLCPSSISRVLYLQANSSQYSSKCFLLTKW